MSTQRWTLRCPAGHEQGVFGSMAQARAALRSPDCGPVCERCGARRRAYGFIVPGAPQVIPDIPEHYNVTLDQPIRSRQHLKDVQREGGFRDYEPQGDQLARHKEFQRRRRHPHTVRMGK